MAQSTIKNGLSIARGDWTGQTVPASNWAVMKTITVPARTKALILANSGNALTTNTRNTCNFILSSGTASVSYASPTANDSGAGNYTNGWFYIETTTECKVQVRQYGYDGIEVQDARGKVIAITLEGARCTIA